MPNCGPLRESSEECAIQLHHYTPQNEIDKGMFCLFRSSKIENNNKNNSNGNDEMMMVNQMIWFKLTRQIQEFQWIYLRDKCLLEILKSFENDYQARKRKLAILREFMRAIIQRAIEEFKRIYESYYSKSHRRVQLVNLWDKCLIHQYERDEFFEFTKKRALIEKKKESDPRPSFKVHPDYWKKNEENLVSPI
ncbi:hypothetical protein Glove_71g188 [Diversispora epigaea]|uniref:Uncharacterized protein n=1 Tax=Diversispora epigaea TaxID=1348612 RepID=A0A397JAU0_9GLOM|nr:hypothetical protein Glove_71g188 [Diversispora epigaea]